MFLASLCGGLFVDKVMGARAGTCKGPARDTNAFVEKRQLTAYKGH